MDYLRTLPLAAVGLLSALALSGCGGDARADTAAATANQLLSAARDGDGAAACALLAPDTAHAVEQAAGRPCPEAIGDEGLPDPGAVTRVEVYGQHAQVAVEAPDGDGTLFLAMFPGGWRVADAGCRPQGDRPYDCAVQGG
ncbi:hypothetical protein ACFO1B_55040 [Dactylosporangium siamense]|uniref:Lipoprotein n=1 Tax=Dactylosporangium siamense TaxID=685454 RepID=A0A919PYK9_9ACTN|nr:hypothetical protein [Dactylosporangium siamense]GIG51636.1 hypothetical protein Dsi01nite_096770 [Dactylosporangium siamense]